MRSLTRSMLSLSAAACMLCTLSACSNTTGSAGQMMYFTEGVITDVEVIDMSQNRYDAASTAAIGAIGGAAAGQIIGQDTKSTLIGAGIGAVIGGVGAKVADRGQGMRITVRTDQGLVLIDQPYSCVLQPGSQVRMINRDGSYQVQVYDGTRYVTAEAQDPSECSWSTD